jgi:hypothetical protein
MQDQLPLPPQEPNASTVATTTGSNETAVKVVTVEEQVALNNLALTKILQQITDLKLEVKQLDTKIDRVENSLNSKIEGVETWLNSRFDIRINKVKECLTSVFGTRINTVEDCLNIKIGVLEECLNIKIESLKNRIKG